MENAVRSEYERLRAELVTAALEWEQSFGIAPGITGALAEVDAAYLVGCELLVEGREHMTAVTKGFDFTFCGKRYQVKANRPSGKPGSPVTITAKPTNYDWDVLIWVLYNERYDIVEAWQWSVDEYRAAFETMRQVRPKHIRSGHCIYQRKSEP